VNYVLCLLYALTKKCSANSNTNGVILKRNVLQTVIQRNVSANSNTKEMQTVILLVVITPSWEQPRGHLGPETSPESSQ